MENKKIPEEGSQSCWISALIDQHSFTMYPVAIVGGGPVGLASSILLSLRRIPHIVFEQYPGTSIHPKAAGLNQRTIEIFRQMGIEDEVPHLARDAKEQEKQWAWVSEKYQDTTKCHHAVSVSVLLLFSPKYSYS